jgi:drug/metabolite transporter (DMT)-like permease
MMAGMAHPQAPSSLRWLRFSRMRPAEERPGTASRVDVRALAAAAATVVLWASAFVSIRSSAGHFGPGALALGRLLVGALVLGGLLLARREGLPPRQAWPGIAASGIVWFGAYMVALNWGEREVDAGTAAMVVNVGPILIALLSGWLLREGFPPRVLGGLGVSFAGAVVVGLSRSGGGASSLLGVALCLVAAVAYAVGVVLQKPALRHASPLQVTTLGCLAGAAVCLPFAGQLVTQAVAAPLTATLQIIYLGVFPTALGFSTWAYALSRTTAGRMGATTYAVPVLAIAMSWAFLDAVPGWLTLLGGLLCLAGVAASRTRGGRSSQKAPAIPAPAMADGQHLAPDATRASPGTR